MHANNDEEFSMKNQLYYYNYCEMKLIDFASLIIL
jgi:hypothetical protein